MRTPRLRIWARDGGAEDEGEGGCGGGLKVGGWVGGDWGGGGGGAFGGGLFEIRGVGSVGSCSRAWRGKASLVFRARLEGG